MEMKKAKGVIEEIKTTQRDIHGKLVDSHQIKLKDNAYRFSLLGSIPLEWKQGTEIEFDYEENKVTNADDSVTVYRNIKISRKGGGFGRNFDDILKALTIPKIHIGFQQEVMTRMVNTGSPERPFTKVLTRVISINVSVNPLEINADEIKKAANLARDALEAEIKLTKGGAAPSPAIPSQPEREGGGEGR